MLFYLVWTGLCEEPVTGYNRRGSTINFRVGLVF
jgi:hypothetical protein